MIQDGEIHVHRSRSAQYVFAADTTTTVRTNGTSLSPSYTFLNRQRIMNGEFVINLDWNRVKRRGSLVEPN